MNKVDFWIIYSWLGVIFFAGLTIPLMNNDSAHHANIALHMYLNNDYVNLIDHGKDYLDKPHLLFWLTAVGYHLFGVTTFAYKLPSLLFSMLALFSTYKLGTLLYNSKVGHWSAIILATAFGFVLSNNDVRMDAILSGCIIFSIWQGVSFINTRKIYHVLGISFGLALGFATKGMIGILMPAISLFVYIIFYKRWDVLWDWKSLVIPFLTFLFISPVLYCYYLQFDLHPEKTIRGHTAISGIKFILWSQNFERFDGSGFGNSSENDPFFFIHTFLWAFIPWSILTFLALVNSIKRIIRMKSRKSTLFIYSTVLIIFILISMAQFKLPHYLNILFPLFALITSHFLVRIPTKRKREKSIAFIQYFVVGLLIIACLYIQFCIFPINEAITIIIGILLVVCAIYHIRQKRKKNWIMFITLYTGLFIHLMFNLNYYPQLLSYQAGQALAQVALEKKLSPDNVFYLIDGEQSNSFDFYFGNIIQSITPEQLDNSSKSSILYTGPNGLTQLDSKGLSYSIIASQPNYSVSTPKWKFLQPETRNQTLINHYLIAVSAYQDLE